MMFRKDKASQTPDHCVHCVYTDDEVAYYMVGTVTEGAGGRFHTPKLKKKNNSNWAKFLSVPDKCTLYELAYLKKNSVPFSNGFKNNFSSKNLLYSLDYFPGIVEL